MSLSSATPGEGTDAARNPESVPVAGRISAGPDAMHRAIDAWCDELRTLGKRSIHAFRQVITAAVKSEAWTEPRQMDYNALSEYFAKKRVEDWIGVTYNRNLTFFRSFTACLKRKGLIATDPLEEAQRAEDDGGEGARAATLEEARRHIRHAWIRDQADGRCKGNRALVWLMLYAHACRVGEPDKLRWKHLHIDDNEPIPFLRWTKEINKNRRLQLIALAPELVRLLREHREQMREWATRCGGIHRRLNRRTGKRTERPFNPADPEAFVFPVIPPRTTFRSDRDAAGITPIDARERGFSPHSARKFFETILPSLGVSTKMTDFMMRHKGTVAARYYDPSLEEQAKDVARLPRLWPEAESGIQKIPERALTAPQGSGTNLPRDSNGTPISDTTERPSPGTSPLESRPGPQWLGRPLVLADLEQTLQCLVGPGLGPVESTIFQSGNADYRIDKSLNSTDLADLLEALARLLRRGAGHVPQRAERA